jgi:predicted P-loop ATPase
MKFGNLNITNKEALHENKIRQVKEFLSEHYDIRINKYKQSEKEIVPISKEYDFPPSLDDISLHMIENEILVSDNILRKIINSPNQIRNFDPIAEYFDEVRGTYNGVSHIDKLCTLITAREFNDIKETGYYQKRLIKYFKKWMVAAVACGLQKEPNQVAMGFIQEEEGTGKTTLCNILTPKSLQMMTQFSDRDKKVFQMRSAFTENFLIVFDECVSLTPHNSETFKSTMSSREIDVREHRDPFPKRKARIANALFTTNNKTGRNKGFLYHSLGTRRFLCFHLDGINLEAIWSDIETDQLWAEALLLYEGGFSYKFDRDDFMEFKQYNTRYFIETNAVVLVENNFTIPKDEADGIFMQPIDILKELKERKLANKEQLSALTPEKIGVALHQLGYEKYTRRIDGIPRKPYLVKPLYK